MIYKVRNFANSNFPSQVPGQVLTTTNQPLPAKQAQKGSLILLYLVYLDMKRLWLLMPVSSAPIQISIAVFRVVVV